MAVVRDEAAANDPGGPHGPVDALWLVLQRLDDLRRGQDDLRRGQDDLRRGQDDLRDEMRRGQGGLRDEMREMRRELDSKIESTRNWSLGLLLLAILGLLTKLLIPAA